MRFTEKNTSLTWTLFGALASGSIVFALSYFLNDISLRMMMVLVAACLAGALITQFVFSILKCKSFRLRIWLAFFTFFSIGVILLFSKWKYVSDRGGEVRQEPFHIAGNLYYVGTKEMSSFLLTDAKGHILIDGGYPGNVDMIIKNIGLLGFRITDVKVLLNSHAHIDHAGGLAELQKASGAQLWVSEPDAELIESGGAGKRNLWLMNFLIYSGLAKYPVPHIDHKFPDGTIIRLGEIELSAHITPGHTPGNTTWAIPITDGERKLLAVDAGSLSLIPSSLFGEKYDGRLRSEFLQSFEKLRKIPADLFLAPHASFFKMADKLKLRKFTKDPASPFIDRKGYIQYIDKAEKKFRKQINEN